MAPVIKGAYDPQFVLEWLTQGKLEILVRMLGFSVYRKRKLSIMIPGGTCVKHREGPGNLFFPSELDARVDVVDVFSKIVNE